jgi:predicted acetyltransferase
MDITYGVAGPEDGEALFALARQGFGNIEPYDPDLPTASPERIRVARVHGKPVSKVAILDMGQFINGGRVSMAGVTSVIAAAEVTGRGVTRRLLVDALADAVERGEPIAALYPTTASLYRSVGFEVAGGWARRALPVAELRRDRDPSVEVEAAPVDVLVDDYDVYRRHAIRSNGWLDRPEGFRARSVYFARREAAKKSVTAYRALRDGETIAIAVATVTPPTQVSHRMYDLDVGQLWGEPDGLTALAATLAGYETVAGEVHTVLPRREFGALTEHPQHCHVVEEWPWMVRILDVATAMAARRAPAIGGEVHLRVHDPLMAANDGPWVLSSSDGHLVAEPGGWGTAEIAVTDLAAVYTGFQAPSLLAAAGRLTGADHHTVTWLGHAFASGEPTMVDFF